MNESDMRQTDDSEKPTRREKHRGKKFMALSAVEFKPIDRELDRKRLEQQGNSREIR
ncbi:hypothetical protein ACSYAD_32705 [Acaryochloris marina NIES-2412]|uniref:hypothetical protein n=1 Tax=Acaryochloris marina TaxID=155978 RepID=UPI004059B149